MVLKISGASRRLLTAEIVTNAARHRRFRAGELLNPDRPRRGASCSFQRIILPSSVRDELRVAPLVVKDWIAAPPQWTEIRSATRIRDPVVENLDAGEEVAIALAIEFQADLLLIDDHKAVLAARRKGIEVLALWVFWHVLPTSSSRVDKSL